VNRHGLSFQAVGQATSAIIPARRLLLRWIRLDNLELRPGLPPLVEQLLHSLPQHLKNTPSFDAGAAAPNDRVPPLPA
jgi:hypothetical protein